MRYAFLLGALLLSGCATPYQPAGPLWGGYSETRLSPSSYSVFAEADSEERAGKMLDLRAAELTLTSGYQKFAIANRTVRMEQRINHVPGHSYSVPMVSGSGHVHGMQTMFTPPRTEVTYVAKGEMTIKMLKGSDPGAAKATDAAATRARLEPDLKGG